MNNEVTSREKAVADSINLRFDSRVELEQGRTDYVRFGHVADYANEDSLQWFHDENLRRLFRGLFHQPDPDVESLLNEALQRSNESPRMKHVVDKLRGRFNLISV